MYSVIDPEINVTPMESNRNIEYADDAVICCGAQSIQIPAGNMITVDWKVVHTGASCRLSQSPFFTKDKIALACYYCQCSL